MPLGMIQSLKRKKKSQLYQLSTLAPEGQGDDLLGVNLTLEAVAMFQVWCDEYLNFS